MKVLALNSGSSSIKYKLFEGETELASGLIERIGEKGSGIRDHAQGIALMASRLSGSGKLSSLAEISAIGHRVVHGGPITSSRLIDRGVIGAIRKYSSMAPLHNPVNLEGIMAMRRMLPGVPNVAVFDTSFHQTMPERAFLYALPYGLYKNHGIRRYGFHGISHYGVSLRAAEMLGKPLSRLNLITCHLGAGCSIAAIRNGKVVDTSMGFTPLEGLVMGTRPGDVDPGVLIFLERGLGMSPREVDIMLNEESGLLGLSGRGKDMRSIIKGYYRGDKRCIAAIDVFCYRVKKYISAYVGILGKVDAITFTAGIGANAPLVRRMCADLKPLGIVLDRKKNTAAIGTDAFISSGSSRVKVLSVMSDEELIIARETLKVLGNA